MKNVVLIQGNPTPNSFCHALANAYKQGAIAAGASVNELDVGQMRFSPNLSHGYKQRMELEDDLIKAQEWIKEADHLVFVYPLWWGIMPALLKGFIDRVFLPGYAFQHRKGSPLWDKLLQGKSARMIVTMDAPIWYDTLILGQAGQRVMKKSVLEYCGIKPVRVTNLGPVRTSNEEKRKKWLRDVEKLGEKLI